MTGKSFYKNVTPFGDKLLVRAVENGKDVQYSVDFKPTVYVPSKKQTEFRTFYGEPVEPMQPGSIRDTKQFIQQYDGVQGWKVFGLRNYSVQWLSETYPGDVDWDMRNIRVFTLDIEVDSRDGFPNIELADKYITAITIGDSRTDKYYVWGLKDYTPTANNIVYTKCKTEIELLESFIRFWKGNYPDVVTGWNVRFFDIAYIVNRITGQLGKKEAEKLSPWGRVYERNISIQGRVDKTYEFSGIAIMDYLELYKKYTYVSQESFALDYIADIELGEEKHKFESIAAPYMLFGDKPSENVSVPADKKFEDCEEFEKLTLIKNRLKAEKIRRGL